MPEYFENRMPEANLLNHQILDVCVPVQMLHRVVMLAAESLKVLEHQLMDGGQVQDVRVGLTGTRVTHHSAVFMSQ